MPCELSATWLRVLKLVVPFLTSAIVGLLARGITLDRMIGVSVPGIILIHAGRSRQVLRDMTKWYRNWKRLSLGLVTAPLAPYLAQDTGVVQDYCCICRITSNAVSRISKTRTRVAWEKLRQLPGSALDLGQSCCKTVVHGDATKSPGSPNTQTVSYPTSQYGISSVS